MIEKYKYKVLQQTVDEAMLVAIKQIEVFHNGKNIDSYIRWKVKWIEGGYDFSNLDSEKYLQFLEAIIKRRFRLKKSTVLLPHDNTTFYL